MPLDLPAYNVGDRVVYDRIDGHTHPRQGQEAVVIGLEDDYANIRFSTPNRYHSYTHMASTRNMRRLNPLSKEDSILRTIRKLEKRQYFYQHTGKDLPAWQHLESV